MSGKVVRLENIGKNYILAGGREVPVLKGIDLEVTPGEFIAVTGASGSGKSTLLNLLGLLDVPTSGKYYLDEQAVENLSDDRLAELRNARIGFIFQSFNLFTHLSVEQNIEVPMVYAGLARSTRRKRATELAERVGLGHRLKHRPSELSGGECQRIAVARSLANNPSFLLADEPTGNLDEKTSKEIINLFCELHQEQGATILMITHNPDLEQYCDRVIRLRDGRIVDRHEVASHETGEI